MSLLIIRIGRLIQFSLSFGLITDSYILVCQNSTKPRAIQLRVRVLQQVQAQVRAARQVKQAAVHQRATLLQANHQVLRQVRQALPVHLQVSRVQVLRVHQRFGTKRYIKQ